MARHKILVIDDDQDIIDLLKYNLEKEGFKVKGVSDSAEAVDVTIEFNPDLIILDIMMPQLNGIEVCKRIRELNAFKNTYIFFLTARSEFYYEEAALETGGDDFIEKIVGLRALTNRVSTVLKQNFIIRKGDPEIHAGKLKINRRSGVAKIGKQEVKLSKPELELLFFFAQNPQKVITADNLLGNIWGSEIYSVAKSMEVYVENLSKKLGHHWIVSLGGGRYKLKSH